MTTTTTTALDAAAACSSSDAASFWQAFPEQAELNQYWYSRATVDKLVDEVRAQTPEGGRCAFLSTPSVYFAVRDRIGTTRECFLLDYDAKFACEGARFVPFDFRVVESVPSALHGTMDFVVVDPPFITEGVWRQYAAAVQLLLRVDTGKLLLTTIAENAALVRDLLGCSRVRFQPAIPHLVYQYELFANYESALLDIANPEVAA